MRPLNYETGLRGPGQVRFPEDIKEWGRAMGLTSTAQLVTKSSTLDPGGAPKGGWAPSGPTFRARIDAIGNPGGSDVQAGQIDEETSHIISCDASINVPTSARIRMDGKDWQVTEKPHTTEPLIQRIEVKGVVG